MPVWLIVVPSLAVTALCLLAGTSATIRRLSVLGSIVSLCLGLAFAVVVLSSGGILGGGSYFFMDALGVYLILLISILALAASLASGDFLEHESQKEGLGINSWRIYYALFHIFIATMFFVAIVNNLGLLWIAIEGTTLASAFLVGFHRRRHSIEAAWKYVILCSIGIAFALLGTILLHHASLSSGLDTGLLWTSFIEAASRLDPKAVKLAFLFVALGYGTKVGLAPMHTWLPDAHSQAPSPVSALLSGALLTSAFYALARFYAIAVRSLGPEFPGNILIFFGLVSLAVAGPFILLARDYKRMLAYSSVEHMGFMALGLGLGTPLALYGALLHAAGHSWAKGLAFFGAGRILQARGTRKITKASALVATMPETGIPYLAALLALSGLPPFSLFVSEIMVLAAGFGAGRYFVSLAALALLVLAFSGMTYHAVQMGFGAIVGKESRKIKFAGGIALMQDWGWSLTAAVFLTLLIVLGLHVPGLLDGWLTVMARIILPYG